MIQALPISRFKVRLRRNIVRMAVVCAAASMFAWPISLTAQKDGETAVSGADAPGPDLPKLQPAQMPVKMLVQGTDGWRELEKAACLSGQNAKLTLSAKDAVLTASKKTTLRLEITSPQGVFDAEGFTRLVVELTNKGASEIKYELRLENEGATDATKCAYYYGWIRPGQLKYANAFFPRKKSALDKFPELKLFKPMKGLPGGLLFEEHNIAPEQIQKIKITIYPAEQDVEISLGSIYASYPVVPPLWVKNPKTFFPFIDGYGQYIHETWPGKVTSDDDLKAAAQEEEKDLAAHPEAESRSKFGGWSAGPRLRASGYFRAEKYDGKWWLVDPEGYLFWSTGPTCVGFGGADTTLAGREYFFSGLPDAGSPLAAYYAKEGSVFMYSQANLFRKYGPGWEEKHIAITQRRLKSWGLNTLGNWSNPRMTNVRQIPYVTSVEFKSPTVTWRKFPDVFSPAFRQNLREAFQTRVETFNDPWCIGYFVQNELKFSDAIRFMEDICKEPAQSPCKIEWIKYLKHQYRNIAEFNQLAGTSLASWDALLANKAAIKLDRLSGSADEFYKKICTIYFQTCKEEQMRVAPHQLYLGCRFLQNVSPVPVIVAAQFCDVVSYNVYEYGIASRTVENIDKPFIVGEFHFGALDRGMFGPGCRWAGDQQDRAGLYKDYVTGALQNRYCVGAHWFQYNSQAFTGRDPDGENYQVGLLDITGNPYPELRDAIREVSYKMYETRMNAQDQP